MTILSETELYAPIKAFLENLGYEVRGEVKSCDVVAVKPDEPEPVIVELKKSFNLALLIQGSERLKLSSCVYLAVEKRRIKRGSSQPSWREITGLCRRLGLGLIAVTFYPAKKPFVEVLCEPIPWKPAPSPKKQHGLLREFHQRSGDFNIGGSSGRKLVTAYREKALHCAWLLKRHGDSRPRDLKAMAQEKDIPFILRDNVYGWFERVERGIYRLSAAGEQALIDYAHVIEQRF